MKKLFILILLFAASSANLSAQNTIDEVVALIEANNTELKASLQELEAAKAANLATVALPDPEVEFAYFFGDPSSLGNRRDFSVSQSVDFSTLTGARKAVAARRNDLLAVEYKAKRVNTLTEARRLCIELVYYNAVKVESEHRLEHAREVADAYASMLEAGSAGSLEYNKAMLNFSAAQSEVTKIDIERERIGALLASMNGGEEVELTLADYPETTPMPSFESWYGEAEQINPVLEYARGQVELGRQELRQARTDALPTLTAGYRSEIVVGQSFRGVAAGLSIPLWSSRGKIDAARQAATAAEIRNEDTRARFLAEVRAEYRRAESLGKTAAFYRQMLDEMNSSELLDEALNEGSLSLLDYIVEIGIYYDTIDNTLSAERDYRIALANLAAYTMQ